MLPAGVRRQLERRSFSAQFASRIHTHPWRETGRLLASRLNLRGLTAHERGVFSVDSVYQTLDRHVARRLAGQPQINAVYSYEDGALNLFLAARRAACECIYDLPIGYWRAAQKLQQEEAELQPDWAPTLSANLDSPEKLDRKDQELLLANRIIVASTFTWKTLALAPHISAPVSIVPYGAPEVGPRRTMSRRGPLKVLFTGILSQRKGVSYLFEAIARLGRDVELTLIGQPAGRCEALERQLKRHRWIRSLPHAEVLQEMGRHDVLVFPSLFEGFGLVILEAMSRGLAVITTPHTAGPDFISDGKDGFIVPIRSSDAIAGKLDTLVHDRDLLQSVGDAARQTAAKHSWQNYRKSLLCAITKPAMTHPSLVANR
jgi:glycosyltransferase involved in cell wall biosynthesis